MRDRERLGPSENEASLVSDQYQYGIEAKCVSQSKGWRPKPEMTWQPRSIPAGHRKTRGTEKRPEQYAYYRR